MWSLFLGACVLLWAQLAAARVLVFPAEVTNLEPGEGEAIVAVVADAYAEASDQQVTLVKADPDAPTGDYPERAKALGGSEYLVIRIVRLEEKVRVRVARHRADGNIVASETMTAVSLDDMEPVAERLALALVQNSSVEDTRTHRNVTGKEVRAKNRVFNEKIVGVKAHLDAPFASGVDIAPAVGIGVDFKLEADSYFLEFGAGFLVPTPGDVGTSEFRGLYSDLGASLYLTDDEISLYAGAGALPRIMVLEAAAVGDTSAANLALYGQFGAMFARSASSRFYTDLRVAQNVTEVPLGVRLDGDDPLLGTPLYETRYRYPTEIILEFGIGW